MYFQPQVKFLGFIVSGAGIQVDDSKTEVIRNWPRPACVSEVRSFSGTVSFYRKHISHFAEIARPLHDLTKKNVPFEWTSGCEDSFTRLKEALCTAPVLAYSTINAPYFLDCDASAHSISGILSQVQGGQEKVVSYFSRVLTAEERRYCTTRRELLAVVASVKHYHHYIYGTKVTVRSDHGSLRWLRNFKQHEDQLARWLELGDTRHV